MFFSLYEFQLTPSRRATSSSRGHCRSVGISTHALTEGDSLIGNNSYAGNISTHALTEGDEQRKTVHGQHIISTHALTEGDVVISVSCLLTWNFNSRPHGGRLHTPEDRGAEAVISTHALTEGDTAPARSPGASEHFNSRPHGGRQHFVLTPVSPLIFQLTPSRRATATYIVILYLAYFNSRPHGGRRCLRVVLRLLAYFNSRPHGGRPSRDSSFSALLKFQLTPSRRATTPPNSFSVAAAHFNSRPHGGRRN